MIKIAYISHFSDLKMGGQRSMFHLIENLDRKRFIPVAVCPEQGELSKRLEEIGCKTFFIPLHSIKPKNYFKVWKSYRDISKFIVKENINIIHPDRDADTLLFGLAKRKSIAKMVWHVRVNAANPKDRWNFSLSDAIICVSKAAGKRFNDFPEHNRKVKIIYNGVDLTKFKPAVDKIKLRQRLGIEISKFILLFVGQITEGKGVFDLLKALKVLKERNMLSNLLCLTIGSFSNSREAKIFKELIDENDLSVYVNYIPQQNNIHEWMAAADALIIPSHEGVEGMPRVLYESMACKVAGIGSNTSGVNEAIDKNSGLLINEKDEMDIAEKISSLLKNPQLLTELQNKGYERAQNMFDIKIHAEKVMKLYDELIENRK